MKNLYISFLVMFFLNPSTLHAQYTTATSVNEDINRLILAKDCAGAEAHARTFFQPPILHTLLGMIYLDCKGERHVAAEFFRMAARYNDTVAIEMLIKLGESSLDPRSTQQHYSNPVVIPPLPVQPPPTHTYSPLPKPRQIPPQVIIVSPPVVQPFNAAACIQDGGGTYCPYYRR